MNSKRILLQLDFQMDHLVLSYKRKKRSLMIFDLNQPHLEEVKNQTLIIKIFHHILTRNRNEIDAETCLENFLSAHLTNNSL